LARFLALCGFLAALTACSPDYSPNTYSSNAVQQANKVDQGTVIGRREVGVLGQSAAGAVAGGAAGGIAGSQIGGGVTSAFGALGGSLVGGVVGSAVEQTAGSTTAYEYVVRKANNDLLSVTQRDAQPLEIGQRVLVIAGSQARIVPDYTVAIDPAPPADHTDGKVPLPPAVPQAPLPPPAVPGASASSPPNPPPSSPSPAPAPTPAPNPPPASSP
jgi:outer membrane lipoprotein SlyB